MSIQGNPLRIWYLVPRLLLFGQVCLPTQSPLKRTTHISNRYSGYATIAHPFHPLHGKRFKILSTKKQGGKDIFSLNAEGIGIIAILRDWTDRADPLPYVDLLEHPPILSVEHLLTLSELLNELDKLSSS